MSEPRKLVFPVLKRGAELPDCFVPSHVEAVPIVFPQRGEAGGVRPAPRPASSSGAPSSSAHSVPLGAAPAPHAPAIASPGPDDSGLGEEEGAWPPDLVPELPGAPEVPEPPRSGVQPMSPMPPSPRAPTPPPPPPRIPPEVEAAMRESVHALATARAQLLAEVEDELVGLAVEIARSMIGAELETRPDLHRALVRGALEVLGPGEPPRVRLSREVHDALVEAFGTSRIEVEGQRLDVVVDPTLHGPGAVIESGGSRVDGLVETRLAAVRRALLDARRATDEHAA